MTVALTDIAFIAALTCGVVAGIWAVGAQGTIDFTRDEATKAAAVREQTLALRVCLVALGVAAVVFFATMAPSINFTLTRV